MRATFVVLTAMCFYLLGHDSDRGRHLTDDAWWFVLFIAVISFVGAIVYVKENRVKGN